MATKQKGKPAKPQGKKALKPARPQKAAKPASRPIRKAAPEKPALRKAGTARSAAETRPTPSVSRTPLSAQLSSGQSRNTQTPSGGSQTDGGVRYLSVQDLVELHRAVSAEFGGNQAQPGVVESQFG